MKVDWKKKKIISRNPSIIRKHVGNLTNLIGMPLDPDNFSTFVERNVKKKETRGILDVYCHANVGFFFVTQGLKVAENNCTDDPRCIECND